MKRDEVDKFLHTMFTVPEAEVDKQKQNPASLVVTVVFIAIIVSLGIWAVIEILRAAGLV
jgi:hypothetical protein